MQSMGAGSQCQIRWSHALRIFPLLRPEALAGRAWNLLPPAQANRTRTCLLFNQNENGRYVRDLLDLRLQPPSVRSVEVTHDTHGPYVFSNDIFFQAGLLHRFLNQ